MAGKHGGKRPGAGRKPGAVSKAKREIAEEAKQYAGQALVTLAEIMGDPDAPHSARVSAANAIIDRGYGKPHQSTGMKLESGDALTSLLDKIGQQGRKVTDD